jgi:DNA-binding transcriptional ArsR family regulator/uncharacterized protein YndB with AHSA1/START domain
MNNDNDLAQVWKALSDPSRRRILDLLRESPRTTGELCDFFSVSRFAIMKHLTILEEAELVLVRRHGRERWNHLNVVPLQQIYERWLRPYEAQWATSLLQLKRKVEQTEERNLHVTEQKVATTPHVLHIEQQVSIQASPARVFEAITNDVSAWWGAPYLISTDAKALIIEPKVGGRAYEDWGNGQGAMWATVTALKQEKVLELTGPLGMSGVVQGVVCFELEAEGDATILKFSHRAIGEVNEQIEAGYNSGWQDLLETRLKAFVEQGIRYGIGHEPSDA